MHFGLWFAHVSMAKATATDLPVPGSAWMAETPVEVASDSTLVTKCWNSVAFTGMSGIEMLGTKMFRASCDILALSISLSARSLAWWWASLTFFNSFSFSIGRKLLFASKTCFPMSFNDIPATLTIGSRNVANQGVSADLAVLLEHLYLSCVVRGISKKAKKNLPTRMDKASAMILKRRFAMGTLQV